METEWPGDASLRLSSAVWAWLSEHGAVPDARPAAEVRVRLARAAGWVSAGLNPWPDAPQEAGHVTLSGLAAKTVLWGVAAARVMSSMIRVHEMRTASVGEVKPVRAPAARGAAQASLSRSRRSSRRRRARTTGASSYLRCSASKCS